MKKTNTSGKGAGVESGLSYKESIHKHVPSAQGQGSRPTSKGTKC